MINLNADRLLHDLRTLETFGKTGTGVNRLAFSRGDVEAREWLAQRMREAGLDAQIDGAGNVYGRTRSASNAVLIGSHTDSVPDGGWLDGCLGVIYGLEIARTWLENNPCTRFGVDVISFEDEEGTYYPCLGSRSFCGELTSEDILSAKNQAGKALVEALSDGGFDGNAKAALQQGPYVAYLEAHIEQGPTLEAEGKAIGIVTGIVGIRRYQITFHGRADHAGTTPMRMREDAGAGLLEFANRLLSRFRTAGDRDTVWNLGRVVFRPGVINIVPSEAQLSVEFRDASNRILKTFEEIVQSCVEEINALSKVRCTSGTPFALEPAAMDPWVMGSIEKAAQGLGASFKRLPSGAGHDAMILARHLPTGMLFIPSMGGRSHVISENSRESDIILGARVLMSTVEGMHARAEI